MISHYGLRLAVRPIPLWQANAYVDSLHRHSGVLPGAKFCVAACLEDGTVVGVAIAGHPKSLQMGDYGTLEVSRVCSDGTFNVCSKLYGACVRAARALGYWRVITYTLEAEAGTSLKASGWTYAASSEHSGWGSHPRPGKLQHDIGPKNRWEILLSDPPGDPVWPFDIRRDDEPDLFSEPA